MPTDFYDVLGASGDADDDELRHAYRSRVREYHPDVNDHPDGQEQFQLIQKAHDVLSNPAERKNYDRLGHREYVETHLDDVPPVSVFPEAAEFADDTSEASTEPSDSDDSSASSRTTGSSADRTASSGQSSGVSGSSGRTRSSGGRQSSGSPGPSSGSRSSSRSESASSASEPGGATTSEQSTSASQSSGTRRNTGSGQTTSQQSTSTDRSNPSAGAERSDSSQWDDIAGDTSTQTTRSSSTSGKVRRHRGLRRWYGVVVLSLLTYFGGIGVYAGPHGDALRELMVNLPADPAGTLLTGFPLPSTAAYVLEAVSTAASGTPGIGLLLVVGLIALPGVILTAVAQFGQGSAWVYAIASLGPVLFVVVQPFVTLPTVVALLGLLVLPLISGFGFLVDVGRYLWATR
jgi:molecular chaperone DnaJ